MDWMNLVLLVITMLLIGFFSGIDIVFSSASRLSIELRKKQGTYSGRMWSFFLEHPARFLAVTLLIFN
jgi:putative hemolysin